MTRRTVERRITAAACGAVLLLAGCGTTSEQATPSPANTPSASAPGPSRADTPSPAPSGPGAVGSPAPPDTPAPEGPAAPAPAAPESPAAPTPGSPAGDYWDPCSLPESDLIPAGLQTASKERISLTSFPACKWLSADQTFDLVISTSDQTMDAVLDPTRVEDVRRSEFYGREFAQFRSLEDAHGIGCHIGTPADFGSIVFTARTLQVHTDAGDPCHDVNRVAAALFNSLP